MYFIYFDIFKSIAPGNVNRAYLYVNVLLRPTLRDPKKESTDNGKGIIIFKSKSNSIFAVYLSRIGNSIYHALNINGGLN